MRTLSRGHSCSWPRGDEVEHVLQHVGQWAAGWAGAVLQVPADNHGMLHEGSSLAAW